MSRLLRIYVDASEENRAEMMRRALPRPGGTLLDLGCSDGRWTQPLAERVRAGRVLGVELSAPDAGEARKRGIEVAEHDLAQPLPYDDASIDVVHSNQVIEHLPGTDHFLREIRRVVRPDGYVLLSTNNLASWHNTASLVLGWQPTVCHVSDETVVGNPANLEEPLPGQRIHRHLRIFTGRALSQLAAFHGLRLDHDGVSGYYPLGTRAGRIASRVDRRHAAYLVHRYVPG